VYSADCFRIHEAIHDRSKTEVKLGSGEVLPVEVASNKCRSVKILGVKFMEQNITKASTYARRAKQGHRITWILQNPRWGMLCDDRIEINCSLINHEPEPVAVKGKKGKGKEAEAGGDAAVKRKASSSAGGESPKKRGTAGDDDGQSSSSSSTAALARSGSTHTLQLSVEFPSYWQPPFAGPREVELEVGGKEFEDLRAMLAKTAERKVDVVRIRRLQSPGLWPQYFLKRKAVQEVNEGKPEKVANMATKLLDPSCNEFQFFHGCSNSVVDKIIAGGFDERLGSLRGLFGSGIYLADNAAKSIQYTHADTCNQVGAIYGATQCTCRGQTNVVRSIFVVRGVMGTPWIRYVATDQDNPMRRPPARPSGMLYDSVMGEAKKYDTLARLQFREIILYDRQQCIPEYIINFKLV